MTVHPIRTAATAPALSLLLLVACGVTPPSGNGAPTVTIASPADEANFDAGATVRLEGSATDPEEGALTGEALEWGSDLDGPIGTGGTVTTDALSEGHHVVTLTATDADGASSTAQIGLRIRPPGQAITVELVIGDNFYEDLQGRRNENAFVRIRLGDTVRWSYQSGSTTHTVTSGEGAGGDAGPGVPAGAQASMASGILRSGEAYTFTPDAAGSWIYYCEIHPGIMFDSVVEVEP